MRFKVVDFGFGVPITGAVNGLQFHEKQAALSR
jgi:hypothetical protein